MATWFPSRFPKQDVDWPSTTATKMKNPSSVSGRVCKWMRGSIRAPQHTLLRLGLNYPRTTLAAWKPFGPFSKSNSTVSPSLRLR